MIALDAGIPAAVRLYRPALENAAVQSDEIVAPPSDLRDRLTRIDAVSAGTTKSHDCWICPDVTLVRLLVSNGFDDRIVDPPELRQVMIIIAQILSL